MPTGLEARQLSFGYDTDEGHTPVLLDVSFAVEEGEIVTLVGPSGCGKSTLLRILAGLVRPHHGDVVLKGQPLSGPSRDIAVIFQHSTLFPWLSVVRNVEFGLRSRSNDRIEIRRHALHWLDMVQLTDRAMAFPSALSGGMAQRAALARALAYSPRVLLLDEPFGSLDALSRQDMHAVLLKLWEQTRMTIVLVTHDIDEAVSISDRVLLLSPRPARIGIETAVDLSRPRVSEGVRCEGFERVRNTVAAATREWTHTR